LTTPIALPWPVGTGLEAATRAPFDLSDQFSADFLRPAGEAALVSPESVLWRVFKNPLSLFIGDVAAVIFKLAEHGNRVSKRLILFGKYRFETLLELRDA
jgi:hypothetical protein